jgi:F0F1-type ATP synthase epsilon subunit
MVTSLSQLERIVAPGQGGLSVELAKYVLSLGFSEVEQARCDVLGQKAQEGALSDLERAEYEDFLALNTFLIVIQAKARASLKDRPSAA